MLNKQQGHSLGLQVGVYKPEPLFEQFLLDLNKPQAAAAPPSDARPSAILAPHAAVCRSSVVGRLSSVVDGSAPAIPAPLLGCWASCGRVVVCSGVVSFRSEVSISVSLTVRLAHREHDRVVQLDYPRHRAGAPEIKVARHGDGAKKKIAHDSARVLASSRRRIDKCHDDPNVKVDHVDCVRIGIRAADRRTPPVPIALRRGYQSRHNAIALWLTDYLGRTRGAHRRAECSRLCARAHTPRGAICSPPTSDHFVDGFREAKPHGQRAVRGNWRVPSMRWHDEAKLKIRMTLSDF